jgi:6-phosphofructokinase 1
MSHPPKLGILVGGGPAPGINSVIGAATIRSVLEGVEVLGIRDGFRWLMEGNLDHVVRLDIEHVSRIHFRGGSHLGISRANPTKSAALLDRTLESLLTLGISQLITIGGDDTAFSAMKLAARSTGRIRVVHVPKTIDNDLDLPAHVDTFGFQTARDFGVEIVKNVMVDAKTTSHWFFVISMGRKAGHLALGIGKAAGATLTLIPEEFGERVPFKALIDTLAGAIIRRLADGRRDGVVVIAEGVVLGIDPGELAAVGQLPLDEHGNPRLSEIEIGPILRATVEARLREFGVEATLVSKNIGYELRCADPTPFDMEYTRDLGYCAAQFLLEGGDAAMVSMQGGQFVPVPFGEMLDPTTGRARVRLVDIHSSRYLIARRYMIRLRRRDFEEPAQLARLARAAHLEPEEFRAQFAHVVANEPEPLHLRRQ